ncbi:UBX domain-containing protein 6 [Microcaecilia unicolor]|uniref:UBX domain-containing protein 6 n=1 Tax=Microcaecilia unicolor TaxID=1415580 RepID=A0A6P7ZHR4_9AMPH|nr:UBX domain-containing protein 6 [Microcaecilia unicolor]
MKRFFKGIKTDMKFKTAGPGHKLTEETRGEVSNEKLTSETPKLRSAPKDGAQVAAAAAAVARMEQNQAKFRPLTSHDVIKAQVKKELEAEAATHESEASVSHKGPVNAAKKQHANLSVSGIYFKCPLTGATLTKEQREAHIREAILLHFSKDPVTASIMQIHTFNRDREQVKTGTETMAKYLENICNHPDDMKYQKIKVSNRIFQERISCLEGAEEFFQAIGFEKKALPIPEQETTEDFYVLKEDVLANLDQLQQHKERLLSAEAVKAKLDRQPCVFQPSAQASQFELPDDFYKLTIDEIKREQKQRTEAVERNAMLRTKAMREKEQQKEMQKYNYTLLRIRLPDGHILQGTFYARERVSSLFDFVRESLQNDWLPFEMLAPGGHTLDNETVAFNECGLVPAALLSFRWDPAVMADIEAAGSQATAGSILKPELLNEIHTLH